VSDSGRVPCKVVNNATRATEHKDTTAPRKEQDFVSKRLAAKVIQQPAAAGESTGLGQGGGLPGSIPGHLNLLHFLMSWCLCVELADFYTSLGRGYPEVRGRVKIISTVRPSVRAACQRLLYSPRAHPHPARPRIAIPHDLGRVSTLRASDGGLDCRLLRSHRVVSRAGSGRVRQNPCGAPAASTCSRRAVSSCS
jgi:hypothetical protein